jgi:hypothetical protein
MSKFAIEETYPGGDETCRWAGLSLEDAAHRMDDLIGIGADVILADWDEDCGTCFGRGEVGLDRYDGEPGAEECGVCHGDGKRSEPWEWTAVRLVG